MLWAQLGSRQVLPFLFVGNLVVLAEHAAQGTAAEKNSAASSFAADTGLFPLMQPRPGRTQPLGAARPGLSLLPPRAAPAGTKFASHHGPSFSGLYHRFAVIIADLPGSEKRRFPVKHKKQGFFAEKALLLLIF